MNNTSIDKDIPVIEPLHDTWSFKQEVGSWEMDIPLSSDLISTKKINHWHSNNVEETVNAFSTFTRPWKIGFGGLKNPNSTVGAIFEWKFDIPHDEYFKKVLQAIKIHPVIIEEIEIFFDMFVHVRTKESPNKPVKKWIRPFGEIVMFYDSNEPELGFVLNMDHTLFMPFSLVDSEDNTELFLLNQPLLENALRLWGKKFSPITNFEGKGTIYKYGFLPDD